MKLEGLSWLHKFQPRDRPEDAPGSFILLIQAPSPASLTQSFIFKSKPRHSRVSFCREQSITKVRQRWTLPRAMVRAAGRDRGTEQRPESSQTQTLQGLLLKYVISPAETWHTKYWRLEGRAELLHAAKRKTEQKEHCKDGPCRKGEERNDSQFSCMRMRLGRLASFQAKTHPCVAPCQAAIHTRNGDSYRMYGWVLTLIDCFPKHSRQHQTL